MRFPLRFLAPLLFVALACLGAADYVPPIIDANARTKVLPAADNLKFLDGQDYVLGTVTGSMFGTASSQKIGFLGATPVIQQTGDVATALTAFGLVTSPTIAATTGVDGTFRIVGSGDATKKLGFEVDAQTTGKTLTINTGAQTLDRTLTAPVLGGNDTFAVLGTAETFSAAQTFTGGATLTTAGLTLTDVNVALGTTTGTKFGTATSQKLAFYNSAPVVQQTGDVATALSTLGLITSPTVAATTGVDGTFRVIGSSDATKKLGFEVDAQTTGKTLTIDTGAQTLDRTLSVPVLSGNDTVATLGLGQTFSGATNAFQAITATNVTDSALTSGRIPVATTGGLLADSANFAWQSTDSRLLLNGAATSSVSITGSGGTPSFASDPGGFIYMGQLGALPTTIDNSSLIGRTDGSGSAPFNNAGSIIYRPRVSATAGRSSHLFYTGSPSTLRLTIDETGLATFAGAVTTGSTMSVGTRAAIGGSLSTACALAMSAPSDIAGATQRGILLNNFVFTSAATSQAIGFSSSIQSAAASFTCTEMDGFLTNAHVLGSGSTITYAIGFRGARQTVGTNNIGFLYGTNAITAGNWGFYNNTADANYFGTGTSTFDGTVAHTAATPWTATNSGALVRATMATTNATGQTDITFTTNGTLRTLIGATNTVSFFDFRGSTQFELQNSGTAVLTVTTTTTTFTQPVTVNNTFQSQSHIVSGSTANTSTPATVFTVGANSTGTAAAGFGTISLWRAETDTTNDTTQATINTTWVIATHASRTSRQVFSIYDTAAREAFRIEASGSAPMIGFLGANAVARPSTTGETTGFTAGAGTAVKDDSTFTGNVGSTAYRVNDLVKHLKNLGLIAQ